jgi:hypothetical protein
MKTILSLQQWLKEEGFDRGPIDGADGPQDLCRVVSLSADAKKVIKSELSNVSK